MDAARFSQRDQDALLALPGLDPGFHPPRTYRATLDADDRLRVPAELARASFLKTGNTFRLCDFPFAAPAFFTDDLWARFLEEVVQPSVDATNDEFALRAIFVRLAQGQVASHNRVTMPRYCRHAYAMEGLPLTLVAYREDLVVVQTDRAERGERKT